MRAREMSGQKEKRKKKELTTILHVKKKDMEENGERILHIKAPGIQS